jgi:hypothetical protein
LLDGVKRDLAAAPPDAQVEHLLVRAYLATRPDPAAVPGLLDQARAALERVEDGDQHACLMARWVDQRSYAYNRQNPPDHAASEALYLALPLSPLPFVRCRRANGLAFLRWKQGRPGEAAALAREAIRYAGDGGHLRLRFMALAMLARVSDGDEAQEAGRRAAAIAAALDDETLRLRIARLRTPR